MGCKTIVEQLQEALGKETIKNSDTFALVENGTLYRVTIGNLATSLGLTGAITSIDPGAAVPVLTGTAPDYEIRGIYGGSGISVAVGPQNTIQVSAKLQNAGGTAAGSSIVKSVTANPLELRRIKAGDGIEVEQQENNIIITNTEVAVTNKTRIISQLSDFPDPVSGVITLDDGADYFLVNDISTANRFVMGSNTVVRSVDPRINTLTYTGTGDMFTTQNGNQGIKEITINCPNGRFVNTTGNTTGALLLRWVAFGTVKDLGALEKPVVGAYDIFVGLITGDGFSFGGVLRRFLGQNHTFQSVSGGTNTLYDLASATFSAFSLQNIQVLDSEMGQTFLSGQTDNQNLDATVTGTVAGVVIDGAMTPLSGITPDDNQWQFELNNSIRSTDPHALVTLDSAATTTIASSATPVVISGSFTEANSQWYDTNVNGRITYKGIPSQLSRISVTVTMRPTGGTDNLTLYIAKNGSVISETAITNEIASGDNENVTTQWISQSETDDFYEVYVANDDTSENIEVLTMIFEVS